MAGRVVVAVSADPVATSATRRDLINQSCACVVAFRANEKLGSGYEIHEGSGRRSLLSTEGESSLETKWQVWKLRFRLFAKVLRNSYQFFCFLW